MRNFLLFVIGMLLSVPLSAQCDGTVKKIGGKYPPTPLSELISYIQFEDNEVGPNRSYNPLPSELRAEFASKIGSDYESVLSQLRTVKGSELLKNGIPFIMNGGYCSGKFVYKKQAVVEDGEYYVESGTFNVVLKGRMPGEDGACMNLAYNASDVTVQNQSNGNGGQQQHVLTPSGGSGSDTVYHLHSGSVQMVSSTVPHYGTVELQGNVEHGGGTDEYQLQPQGYTTQPPVQQVQPAVVNNYQSGGYYQGGYQQNVAPPTGFICPYCGGLYPYCGHNQQFYQSRGFWLGFTAGVGLGMFTSPQQNWGSYYLGTCYNPPPQSSGYYGGSYSIIDGSFNTTTNYYNWVTNNYSGGGSTGGTTGGSPDLSPTGPSQTTGTPNLGPAKTIWSSSSTTGRSDGQSQRAYSYSGMNSTNAVRNQNYPVAEQQERQWGDWTGRTGATSRSFASPTTTERVQYDYTASNNRQFSGQQSGTTMRQFNGNQFPQTNRMVQQPQQSYQDQRARMFQQQPAVNNTRMQQPAINNSRSPGLTSGRSARTR